MSKSFRFTHAICRVPGRSIADGLRAADAGNPDHRQFMQDHADYVTTLQATGAEVHVLPALEQYPDSVFVEDAALCLQELAIIMRPGAPTRLGEAAEMEPSLARFYDRIARIKGEGFIEGGDILVTETEILVGKSARTDAAGVAALRDIVADYGYSVREVETPGDVLHFKTDSSLLDGDTILATERLSRSGCFDGYRVIHTEAGEEASANAIRFNDLVLFPRGFPKTAEKLRREGFKVHEIGNSEAAKVDGGMSCLSLRFSPKG